MAGIYFKVKDNSDDFTIFYHDGGKQRMKMNFSIFLYPKLVITFCSLCLIIRN